MTQRTKVDGEGGISSSRKGERKEDKTGLRRMTTKTKKTKNYQNQEEFMLYTPTRH